MDAERLDDLVAGAALGDLDAVELGELTGAAETDPAVGRRLEMLRRALDLVAFDPPLERPPERVRMALLRAVEAGAEPAARPARRIPRAWLAIWAGAGTVAAIAAIVVAAFLGSGQGGRDQLLEQLIAETEGQRAALVGIYRDRPHIMPLQATDTAAGAWARLMMDDQGRQAMLVVDGLHPPATGQAYQLWLLGPAGIRISGAVFSTDLEGRAIVVLDVDESLLRFSQAGVTVEPAGGSAAPTGARMLFGNLR